MPGCSSLAWLSASRHRLVLADVEADHLAVTGLAVRSSGADRLRLGEAPMAPSSDAVTPIHPKRESRTNGDRVEQGIKSQPSRDSHHARISGRIAEAHSGRYVGRVTATRFARPSSSCTDPEGEITSEDAIRGDTLHHPRRQDRGRALEARTRPQDSRSSSASFARASDASPRAHC
jgi:hypothetical protein